MQSLLNAFGGIEGEAGGGIGISLAFGLDYDLTGLRFQTISAQNDTAVVSIDGEIVVSVLGVFRTVEIPLSPVDMQYDGGLWKVCDVTTP